MAGWHGGGSNNNKRQMSSSCHIITGFRVKEMSGGGWAYHVLVTLLLSCVSMKSVGTNVGQGVLTMVSYITQWQPMTNVSCHSSFGCHITVSDVAPGFRVRGMSGRRKMSWLTLACCLRLPFVGAGPWLWAVVDDSSWFCCWQSHWVWWRGWGA